MKKRDLLLLLLFVAVILGGMFIKDTGELAFSPGEIEFNVTFGGSASDVAYDVVKTSDGGYILVGYTESFGVGNRDGWIVKTDSNGNEDWSNAYGGVNADTFRGVQETTDGGYIVAGYTDSFGPSGTNGWVVKIDSNGINQWSKTFGDVSNDWIYDVEQTFDGGYVLMGATNSFGAGSADGWVVKTDSNGNEDWSNTYGGTGYDILDSIDQTSDGGYILSGQTGSFGAGSTDGWIVKTNSFGFEDWNKPFGGTGIDNIRSIKQTSDGGYILAGFTGSFGAGGDDSWIVKTDSNGNEDWSNTYGGTGNERANSIIQTSDGGYAISGETNSFGAGNKDGWIIKTDSNGNEDWSNTFGGTSYDIFHSMDETSDGGFISGGYTNSFGAGSHDFLIVKTKDSAGPPEILNVGAYPNPLYLGQDLEVIAAIIPDHPATIQNAEIKIVGHGSYPLNNIHSFFYKIYLDTHIFGEGTEEFNVTATDNEGNYAEVGPFTFTVNPSNAPVISNIGDTPDPSYTFLDDDIEFSADISPYSGRTISSAHVIVSGEGGYSMTHVGGNSYKVSVNSNVFGSGTYNYQINATDDIGLTSISGANSFLVKDFPGTPGPRCGDGNVNPNIGEECDGFNLSGETCQTQGFDSGPLSCYPEDHPFECMLDTSNCVDTTKPVISDVEATPRDVTATILWETNENADSKVEYGIESEELDEEETDNTLESSHSITLTGLDPDTLYYYVVTSKDASNNEQNSTEFNFTTDSDSDTAKPIISNIRESNLDSDSVTIRWETNEPTDSLVEYGRNPGDYDYSERDSSYVKSRTIVLTNLRENTKYYYRVTSEDPAGNGDVSSELTFTTLAASVQDECDFDSDCSSGEVCSSGECVADSSDDTKEEEIIEGVNNNYLYGGLGGLGLLVLILIIMSLRKPHRSHKVTTVDRPGPIKTSPLARKQYPTVKPAAQPVRRAVAQPLRRRPIIRRQPVRRPVREQPLYSAAYKQFMKDRDRIVNALKKIVKGK